MTRGEKVLKGMSPIEMLITRSSVKELECKLDKLSTNKDAIRRREYVLNEKELVRNQRVELPVML